MASAVSASVWLRFAYRSARPGGYGATPRRVRQQVAQRDRPRRLLEGDACPSCLAVGDEHLAAELGQVLLDVVDRLSFPSSARIMMPMAVIGLVIEAMRKSVSFGIGVLRARSREADGLVVDDAVLAADDA